MQSSAFANSRNILNAKKVVKQKCSCYTQMWNAFLPYFFMTNIVEGLYYILAKRKKNGKITRGKCGALTPELNVLSSKIIIWKRVKHLKYSWRKPRFSRLNKCIYWSSLFHFTSCVFVAVRNWRSAGSDLTARMFLLKSIELKLGKFLNLSETFSYLSLAYDLFCKKINKKNFPIRS